jgi:glycosyltransferase involved in cell wall biosynthesis
MNTPDNRQSQPFWSVMIPTYRPDGKYLRQTLESVLQQDPGPKQMQIEVVDDCSPGVDVAAMVKSIAGERVKVSRTPRNLGLAGCWNTCIERSRGKWVHLLHQDDYVLPGFYQALAVAAECNLEAGLLATRSFILDADGEISGVTERLTRLERGGRAIDDFFYGTPIQCAGVVVRRSVFETLGGFRSDLKFTLDCEMWARVIHSAGGVVTSDVLSCYRMSDTNETGRLNRTAESLHDLKRLHQIFAAHYPGFDSIRAMQRIRNMSLDQAESFSRRGDAEAAKANLNFWKKNTPASLRFRRFAGKIVRGFFR